jgi:hypothetical protein
MTTPKEAIELLKNSGVSEEFLHGQPSKRALADDAFERFVQWADEVEFNDYKFNITLNARGELYMRAKYPEADTYTGEPAVQVTRRWLLTPPMTKSEFIQTCFKCAITSMEHRTREAFKYKGRRVFGPHFDVDDLWRLCEGRENAGGRG